MSIEKYCTALMQKPQAAVTDAPFLRTAYWT